MNENIRCGACLYFDGSHCKRHAPRAVQRDGYGKLQAEWPFVAEQSFGWCGDWEPSAKGKPQD